MKLTKNICRKILISLITLLIIMHLGVILAIIPTNIVWGGKILSHDKIVLFEIISIIILVVLILTLMMDGKYFKPLISEKSIRIILWIFFTFFLLNTFGNIFAKSSLEKFFSLLTSIFSFLIFFILKRNDKIPHKI